MKTRVVSLLVAALFVTVQAFGQAGPLNQTMNLGISVDEVLFVEQSHIYEVCEPLPGPLMSDIMCQAYDEAIHGSAQLHLGRVVDLVGNIDWDSEDVENFRGQWLGWFQTQLRYGSNHATVKQITVKSNVVPKWLTKIEAYDLHPLFAGAVAPTGTLGTLQGETELSAAVARPIIKDIKQAFGETYVRAKVQADVTDISGTQNLVVTFTIADQ